MKLNSLFAPLVAVFGLLCALPANAAVILFQGTFAPEATGATGNGALSLRYDDIARTLAINATWQGLSGNTTTAHIHCCTAVARTGTAGVALAQAGILPGFPLGAQSGSYISLIDLSLTSQYSAAFITASGGTTQGAESRLIGNLASGNAYFNIHSSTFGGGEIRAFVSRVPLPGSLALILVGAAGVFLASRKKAFGI